MGYAPKNGPKATFYETIIILSRITWVEVLSAFSRLWREGKIDRNYITSAIQTFRYDLDTFFRVIETEKAIIVKAGEFVQKHPLRAYDSVQLASAMTV